MVDEEIIYFHQQVDKPDGILSIVIPDNVSYSNHLTEIKVKKEVVNGTFSERSLTIWVNIEIRIYKQDNLFVENILNRNHVYINLLLKNIVY